MQLFGTVRHLAMPTFSRAFIQENSTQKFLLSWTQQFLARNRNLHIAPRLKHLTNNFPRLHRYPFLPVSPKNITRQITRNDDTILRQIAWKNTQYIRESAHHLASLYSYASLPSLSRLSAVVYALGWSDHSKKKKNGIQKVGPKVNQTPHNPTQLKLFIKGASRKGD